MSKIEGLHLFLNSHSTKNKEEYETELPSYNNHTGILHFSLYQENEFGNLEKISSLEDVLIKNTTENRVALYSGILGLEAVERYIEENKINGYFPNTLLHIYSLQNHYLFDVFNSQGEKWKKNGYFEVQEEDIGPVIENVTLVKNLLDKKEFLKQNNLILKTDFLGSIQPNENLPNSFETRIANFHNLHDNLECNFYSSVITILEQIPNYNDYYIQQTISKQHYNNDYSNSALNYDSINNENNLINELGYKTKLHNKKTEEKIDFSELKELNYLTQKRDELSIIIEEKLLEKQQIEEKIKNLQERNSKNHL